MTGSSSRHRLFLVSCASSKRSQQVPARELYVSPLFLKARAHVEAQGSPWFILSAKHGLLAPETVVSPYDQTLNTMPIQERREWADRVLAELLPRLAGIATVILLAGRRYREFLEAPLASRVTVEVPFAGMRIGEQLRWYVDHARHQ